MGFTTKTFEELSLIDDYMMNAVAADPQYGKPFCKRLLSVLLGSKIGEIGEIRINVQQAIPANALHLRGIRMDVEVEEFEGPADVERSALNIYDLEPHLREGKNIAKHNRFYQAKIDGRYLRRGETDFSKLPNLYVLTITDFDPFGRDYMVYTFQNKCEEQPDLPYEDGLKFLYFNTKGKKGGSPELKAMLNYIQNSTDENVTDQNIREVHECVQNVKVLPEVKEAYMRLGDIIDYEREEASLRTQVQNILDLLEDYGEVPERIRERLEAQKDAEVLRQWVKHAARAGSMEDFEKKIG